MTEDTLSLEEAAARIKVKAPISSIQQSVVEKPLLEVDGLNTWFPIKKGIFARTGQWGDTIGIFVYSDKNGVTLHEISPVEIIIFRLI